MRKKSAYKASALVITLVFIVLLGLEALMVSMVLVRSTGAEASLRGENIQTRRAADLVLDTLKQAIYTDMTVNELNSDDIWTKYKRGGSDSTFEDLSDSRYEVVDPESGDDEQLGIETAGWLQEKRGDYYHLVGRARQNGVDLLTHRWVMITPSCVSSEVPSGLTTIATGINAPGIWGTEIDPITGRVFFSNINDDDFSSISNLFTWHPTTGLSTILPTNRRGVGSHAMQIADDGRLFFGSNSTDNANGQDTFWTWKDNVLTTIVDNLSGPGRWHINGGKFTKIDKSVGRVFFGTAWQSNVFTWKNGALTTIMTDTGSMNDYKPAGSRIINGVNPEEVFYTDYTGSSWKLFRWTPASGLETVLTLSSANTPFSAFAQSDGRIWMVDYDNSGKVRSYKSGSGLSTLPGTYKYIEMWDTDTKMWNFAEFADNSVFFSSADYAYVWRPSSPNAITQLPTLGKYAQMNPDKTMIAYSRDSSSPMYVWGTTNGLSTVPGTWASPARHHAMTWGANNTLYFAPDVEPGRLYSWDASTQQLSTIIKAVGFGALGQYRSMATDMLDPSIIYVGSQDTSGASAYAYSPSGGLTTLVSNRVEPTGQPMTPSPFGGVFFGEYNSSGNFYYYSPGGTAGGCASRNY